MLPNRTPVSDNGAIPQNFRCLLSVVIMNRDSAMLSNSLVVILDDDLIHGRFLEKTLADEGIAAQWCESSEECQEKLKAKNVAAIFVDLWESGARRLSFIQWVRENRPDLRIVAMSHIDSFSFELASLNRGADFFVAKPVDSHSVRRVLSREPAPASFSGSIPEVDLIELLQFFLLAEKKAILEISSHDGVTCRLYLRDAVIVHAECGDVRGEEAFYRCLCFRGGTFSVIPWEEPEKETIRKAREFLLMDADQPGAKGSTAERYGLPSVYQLDLSGHDRPRSRIGRLSERFGRLPNQE